MAALEHPRGAQLPEGFFIETDDDHFSAAGPRTACAEFRIDPTHFETGQVAGIRQIEPVNCQPGKGKREDQGETGGDSFLPIHAIQRGYGGVAPRSSCYTSGEGKRNHKKHKRHKRRALPFLCLLCFLWLHPDFYESWC